MRTCIACRDCLSWLEWLSSSFGFSERIRYESKLCSILWVAIVGFAIAFCINLSIGASSWLSNNPSLSELNLAVEENMNLTESAQVSQMIAVGAFIDFNLRVVLLYVLPIACVSALLGLLGGFGWYMSKKEVLL